MTADDETIQKLRRYASWGIHKLAQHDVLLAPIDELVRRNIADPDDTSDPLDEATARSLVKYLPEHVIGTPFDERTVRNYHEIGKTVFDVATNPESDNDNMVKVAMYLHPLFSQDDRTVDMGFDLEEYMDWYFNDTTREEREEDAKRLMEGWYLCPCEYPHSDGPVNRAKRSRPTQG